MARVPDFKRLSKEDFPAKYRDLIEKLALPINSHIEQVRNALNGNLDFVNLAQEAKTFTFTTDVTGQPLTQITFNSGLSSNVQGMLVSRVVITSNNTAFANTLPVVSWSQSNNLITITNIGGLQPETAYQLSVLTF